MILMGWLEGWLEKKRWDTPPRVEYSGCSLGPTGVGQYRVLL